MQQIASPLLTILIPTYNRPQKLEELFDSFVANKTLLENFEIEFVISENVPAEYSEIQDLVSFFEKFFPVKLVHPHEHLISAEENLFFGWQFTRGKFVWILGDDDPVNFDIFVDLLMRCNSNLYEILKYNATYFYNNSSSKFGLVTKSVVHETEMDFLRFLQNVGFWHTGAGFSTWIFRRDCIDPIEGFSWVQSFRSPVYSHVTYFAKACHSRKVSFINESLVNYRVNEYVTQDTEDDNHWSRYTKSVNMPRYFPWTLGFVEQLLALEQAGVIDREYWRSVIGDHFESHRFLESNSMIKLAYRQLELEYRSNEICFAIEDWQKLINFFESIRPDMNSVWLDMLSFINENSGNLKFNETELKRLKFKIVAHLDVDPFHIFRLPDNQSWVQINGIFISGRRTGEIVPKLYLGYQSEVREVRSRNSEFINSSFFCWFIYYKSVIFLLANGPLWLINFTLKLRRIVLLFLGLKRKFAIK